LLKYIPLEVVLGRYAFKMFACLKVFHLSFICGLGKEICVQNKYT
jgi:hypothetical protein